MVLPPPGPVLPALLSAARGIAASLGHQRMDTEHVALALLAHDLQPLGIDPARWLTELRLTLELQRKAGYRTGPLPALPADQISTGRRAQAALELAVQEASANGHDVEVRHVVIGLLRERGGMAAGTLAQLGVRLGQVRKMAGLLPQPRLIAGGMAPPDGSQPTPTGPLVLLGGGPGTEAALSRVLSWTAQRLAGAPRVVQLFLTEDGDRGNDAHIAEELQRWRRRGAATAKDGGVYDRTDAFLPQVRELLLHADLIHVPGGFPDRAYDVLWGTPALDAIRAASDRGTVLVGVSAGARMWGIGMLSDLASDEADQVFPLIGWVSTVVFNHYHPAREAEVRKYLGHWPGASALAISNGAAVLVHEQCTSVSLLAASAAGEGAFLLPSPDSDLIVLSEQHPTALPS